MASLVFGDGRHRSIRHQLPSATIEVHVTAFAKAKSCLRLQRPPAVDRSDTGARIEGPGPQPLGDAGSFAINLDFALSDTSLVRFRANSVSFNPLSDDLSRGGNEF